MNFWITAIPELPERYEVVALITICFRTIWCKDFFPIFKFSLYQQKLEKKSKNYQTARTRSALLLVDCFQATVYKVHHHRLGEKGPFYIAVMIQLLLHELRHSGDNQSGTMQDSTPTAVGLCSCCGNIRRWAFRKTIYDALGNASSLDRRSRIQVIVGVHNQHLFWSPHHTIHTIP